MLRLNGTSIAAIENISSSNVAMAALKSEYRMALSHKISVVDTAGNSYVGSRTLVQFLLGAECKRIDKEIEHKKFTAMQTENVTAQSDYVERNPKYKETS